MLIIHPTLPPPAGPAELSPGARAAAAAAETLPRLDRAFGRLLEHLAGRGLITGGEMARLREDGAGPGDEAGAGENEAAEPGAAVEAEVETGAVPEPCPAPAPASVPPRRFRRHCNGAPWDGPVLRIGSAEGLERARRENPLLRRGAAPPFAGIDVTNGFQHYAALAREGYAVVAVEGAGAGEGEGSSAAPPAPPAPPELLPAPVPSPDLAPVYHLISRLGALAASQRELPPELAELLGHPAWDAI